MRQIRSILKSVNKEKPKILTVFTSFSQLKMLEGFDVYCLIVEQFSSPKVNDGIPGIIFINDWRPLEFDLCVSFTGGIIGKTLSDIALERHIDCITYELNYPTDISTCMDYISSNKSSIFPSESFKKKVSPNGNNKVITPSICPSFASLVPPSARQINAVTYGDFLFEREYETNFSDWRSIVNTLPSQIYGFNPRLGTHNPTQAEFANILTNTKVFINLRTSGFFPMEVLQAMACGCVIISYPFPGIDSFVNAVQLKKNKEECREMLSYVLANEHYLNIISAANLSFAKNFKSNLFGQYIKETWENINEFGFQHYRISGL